MSTANVAGYASPIPADSASNKGTLVLRDASDSSINVGQANVTTLNSSANIILGNEVVASSVTAGAVAVHLISGAYTLTLPAAAASAGQTHIVKKTDNTTSTVVKGNASELIDAANTKTSTVQYSALILYCDGTKWHVVGSVGTWP